jgi:hypothetical protein
MDAETDESGTISERELAVYAENMQVGDRPVTPKKWDEYLSWAGCRQGRLCTLQRDEGPIVLEGNGHGVLITGAWTGPRGPFPATDALQKLADADVLESVSGYMSGVWGPDDVATLVAPFTYYDDFEVDGEEWMRDGERAHPMHPRNVHACILAELPWELLEDASYSISSEDGAEVLTRIGPRYVMYFVDGPEQEREDLDATDDATALAAFKKTVGVA